MLDTTYHPTATTPDGRRYFIRSFVPPDPPADLLAAVKRWRPDADEEARWWSEAGREFRRSIDDDIRRREPDGVLPWERPVRVGEPDYWSIHAHVLDRLAEYLARVLPYDHEYTRRYTVLRGRHDEHANLISVSLISGAWTDPTARRHGRDLVSLTAHVYRTSRPRAARLLGQWMGLEGTRYV